MVTDIIATYISRERQNTVIDAYIHMSIKPSQRQWFVINSKSDGSMDRNQINGRVGPTIFRAVCMLLVNNTGPIDTPCPSFISLEEAVGPLNLVCQQSIWGEGLYSQGTRILTSLHSIQNYIQPARNMASKIINENSQNHLSGFRECYEIVFSVGKILFILLFFLKI